MGHCSPHQHASSTGLLFWDLFSIRVWGITACFGGVSSSVFSVLTKVGVGTSSIFGGIGHGALATNKLVEAGIVFGHGVAMVAALGSCTIGGLSGLEVNGLSSSWNLLVDLGISWIFPWARLYTITGIGLGLAVVVVGFTTDIGVEVTIVAIAFGSGKDFSISLTMNHLFMGVLVLLFLSAACLRVGTFCGGVVLPSWLVLVHSGVPLLSSSSR